MPKHNKPLSGGNNWNRKPDKIKHNKKPNNNPWSQNYGKDEESTVYGNNTPSYKYAQPQLLTPEELLSPIDENGQKLANFASRVAVNVWKRQNSFAAPKTHFSFAKEKNCNCEREEDYLGEFELPYGKVGLRANNVPIWERQVRVHLESSSVYRTPNNNDNKCKPFQLFQYQGLTVCDLPYSFEYDAALLELRSKSVKEFHDIGYRREYGLACGENLLRNPTNFKSPKGMHKMVYTGSKQQKMPYFMIEGQDEKEVASVPMPQAL